MVWICQRPVAQEKTLSQLIESLSRLRHAQALQPPYALRMANLRPRSILGTCWLIGVQGLLLLPLASARANPQPVQVYGRRMEALFVRMDVNGDGRLESREVQGQPYLERRLQRPDSRGYLLIEDLSPRSPHPSGQRLQQRFRQADRNGDGQIDRRECRSLPWLSRNFISFDLNGDGGLTLGELWTVQRSLAPRP